MEKTAWEGLKSVFGVISETLQKSDELIEQVRNLIVQYSTDYPNVLRQKDEKLEKDFLGILDPDAAIEDKSVAIITFARIFFPYYKKMYEENGINTETWEAVKDDGDIVLKFYSSIQEAIKFKLDSQGDYDKTAIAEGLFNIGPLFVKMVQSFAGILPQTSEETTELAKYLSRTFKESVSKPSEEQVREDLNLHYNGDLPEWLDIESLEVKGSASIGYVVKCLYKGQVVALKVKRQGIEKAFQDNLYLLKLVGNVIIEFTHTHSSNQEFSNMLTDVKSVIDFMVAYFEETFIKEFDYLNERSNQEKMYEVFKWESTLHIPKIHDELSNTNVIGMEYMEFIGLSEVTKGTRLNVYKNLWKMYKKLKQVNFLHGDLHSGNLKATTEGNLVILDWWQCSTFDGIDIWSIFQYGVGSMLGNVKMISRWFARMSGNKEKADVISGTILQSILMEKEMLAKVMNKNPEASMVEQFKMRIKVRKEIHKMILLSLAINHQLIFDQNIIHFSRSLAPILEVLKDHWNNGKAGIIV